MAALPLHRATLNGGGQTMSHEKKVITAAQTYLLCSPRVTGRAARGLAALGVAALSTGLTERGRIVGWLGGNAVIYPTAGSFTNPKPALHRGR